ncbi:MAG: hypothetical protein ABJA81_07395 [Nocardioidaceae bacterium]
MSRMFSHSEGVEGNPLHPVTSYVDEWSDRLAADRPDAWGRPSGTPRTFSAITCTTSTFVSTVLSTPAAPCSAG